MSDIKKIVGVGIHSEEVIATRLALENWNIQLLKMYPVPDASIVYFHKSVVIKYFLHFNPNASYNYVVTVRWAEFPE